MVKTNSWAKSLGVPSEEQLAPVEGFSESYKRTAQEVAIRSLVLQGVVAVASGVGPEPIIAWFQDQTIWDHTTPGERRAIAPWWEL